LTSAAGSKRATHHERIAHRIRFARRSSSRLVEHIAVVPLAESLHD
jgi:hypothetical protein